MKPTSEISYWEKFSNLNGKFLTAAWRFRCASTPWRCWWRGSCGFRLKGILKPQETLGIPGEILNFVWILCFRNFHYYTWCTAWVRSLSSRGPYIFFSEISPVYYLFDFSLKKNPPWTSAPTSDWCGRNSCSCAAPIRSRRTPSWSAALAWYSEAPDPC